MTVIDVTRHTRHTEEPSNLLQETGCSKLTQERTYSTTTEEASKHFRRRSQGGQTGFSFKSITYFSSLFFPKTMVVYDPRAIMIHFERVKSFLKARDIDIGYI